MCPRCVNWGGSLISCLGQWHCPFPGYHPKLSLFSCMVVTCQGGLLPAPRT